MTNLKYLFFGDNGEYVLSPIYNEMRKCGFDCVELDIAKESNVKQVVDSLKGFNIVFVTCAHLFLDKCNMDIENRHYKETISAIELVDYLNPIKKVYYPHDLLDGFNHYDKLHFSLFDIFLSPLPINAHGIRFCDVINVGWVKKHNKTPEYHKGDEIKFAFTFSEDRFYFPKGMEHFYKTFQDIFDEGVKIKVPNCNIASFFTDILKVHNIDYYDPAVGIYDLIDENFVIITNGMTACTLEASLSGRMVINLLDGVHNASYQRSKLFGLPNVHILPIDEAVEMIKGIKSGAIDVEVGDDIMKPFDMELAIKSIIY